MYNVFNLFPEWMRCGVPDMKSIEELNSKDVTDKDLYDALSSSQKQNIAEVQRSHKLAVFNLQQATTKYNNIADAYSKASGKEKEALKGRLVIAIRIKKGAEANLKVNEQNLLLITNTQNKVNQTVAMKQTMKITQDAAKQLKLESKGVVGEQGEENMKYILNEYEDIIKQTTGAQDLLSIFHQDMSEMSGTYVSDEVLLEEFQKSLDEDALEERDKEIMKSIGADAEEYKPPAAGKEPNRPGKREFSKLSVKND